MATITRATGETQSPGASPGATAIAKAVRLAVAAGSLLALLGVPAGAEAQPYLTVSGTSHTVNATDTANGAIRDNDGVTAQSNKTTLILWLSHTFLEEDGGAHQVTLYGRLDGGNIVAGLYPVVIGGTATSADYTISPGNNSYLSIPSAGKTYTITPKNNSTKAADKTITFSISGDNSMTSATATLTLADDEVTLSSSTSEVREFYGSQLVTVTARSGKSTSARTVVVQVGKSTDGATEGTDYNTVNNFNITIPANATSATGTFTLTPKQDTSVESPETISIAGTISGSTVVGTTITMYDDDMTLSVNPTSVDENAGSTSVTVTATAGTFPSARTVRVQVGKSSDGAKEGTDYANVPDFNVTINANATSGTATFTLTPVNDYHRNPVRSISISGSATNHGVAGTTMYVTDDEGRKDVTLTLSTYSVSESGGAQTVNVEVSDQSDNHYGDFTATVSVGHSSDSATEGTDYATVADFTINVPYNTRRASKSFTLTPTNDSSVEGTERIAVVGTGNYKSVESAYLYLHDDDGTTITLSSSPSSVSEGGASDTPLTVTATAAKAVSAATTVNVVVGDTGSATYRTDYLTYDSLATETSQLDVTIPANGTSGTGTLYMTMTDDALVEGNETIGLTGSSTGHTVTAGSLTLSDNDTAPAVNLTLNRSSLSEGASATAVTVSAAFSNNTRYPSDKTVTVSVGGSGTATSGTDYAAVSNFDITIKAGSGSAAGTFTLTPTNDTSVENHETIGISGTSTGLTVNGATLTLNDNDSDAVTLSANKTSIAESGTKTTVTVTATAATSLNRARTVAVSVGGSGDGATEGTDYATVADFNVTIAANSTSGTGTFFLTPTQDTLVEGDETVGITGSGTLMTVTGTNLKITDDDVRTIALSTNKTTVSEGAGATTVTVTATADSAVSAATSVTVAVGASGDGATEGTDYTTVADFTVTIAANNTKGTGTFTLTPTDDTTYEGEESVSVTGTSSPHTVTGTSLAIGNNDGIGITLSVSPTSVVEGAGSTSVTVTATAAKTALADIPLTVQVGKSSDSATEGTDYPTVNDFTLTISKGGKTGTGTFSIIPNSDKKTSEGNETISVSGTSSPHTVTGASLTLTDATASNPITLSVSPSSVSEGAGETTVNVTAKMQTSFVKSGDMTVTVGTSGSAKSGTDYAAVSDITLTFAANSNTATGSFKLTPTDDSLVEANETVWVDGSSSSGQVVGASVTIADNDGTSISLSADTTSVSEGASAKTVTVTATAGSAASAARTVTVSVGRNGDTAIEGTDYSTVSDFTITIAANKTSGTGTFTLTPTQDTVVEGSESLTISGSGSQMNVSSTSVSLTDDDTAPAVNLSLSPTSVTEGEKDQNLLLDSYKTVTVTATYSPANTYDHDKTVAVSVGGSGTATSGTDYTAVSNFNVKISAGQTSGTGTFQLTSTDDSVYEGNETIGVAGTSTGLTVNSATLTLADNDSAEVTVNDANADEGDAITFTVTLDKAVQGGLTVTPGYTNGTTADADYTKNTTALSFTGTAGETKTFTVSTTEDAVLEADETFTVGLTVSNAPSGVIATDTGTGTIDNDDSAEVTVNDANADEGDAITFTVTLSEAVQGDLTVTPSFTDVTAVEGTDYDENTAALSFTGTKGETKTFTVSTTEDAVLEADETFTVGLTVSGTTLTGSITSTDTGTGTINNDDSAEVTVNDASADEGESMTFTVTLDKAVQGGLTVTPGYTHGTAAKSDYSTNTNALSFTGTKGESKTFTVSTTEDAVLEANETFTVGLTVSGTTLTDSITSTDTGTGTINNDDRAAVTVNDASASEGDDITFTVTLSEAVQGGLTVTPGYTNGTTADADYTKNATALSFTGTKDETQTFTVSTTTDAVLEANETFTVGLTVSNAPSGVTATDTGTGTIDNDDSAAVTVNDANADEGDAITFTVTLDKAVQGGLTVTPGYTNNGTTADADYTKNTTALSFTGTAGETKTFTVSTTEDAVLEADETFTVGLTVSNAPSGVTATDTGTGTIDNDDGATVTVNNASASEGESMTFTVSLGAAVAGGLTVTPFFTDVTAVEGTDYDENTAALSFTGTKGETKTFTVSTDEDAVLEANETFTVGLTVSDTTLSITATDTGTGTINNDDRAAVTVNNANASEGDDITFTVTLDEAVQGGLTVTPSYTNGTAASTDYTANTTALSFTGTKGETKTFTVSTKEDAVLEANETLTVGLSVSGTSLSVTASDTGTGTINNDDGTAVTVNNANASEGDAITFTVTLSEAVQGGLTVTPSFTDGTAVAGTDYTENTTALSFTGTKGETKTITVATTEDAVVEAVKTFKVKLTVSNVPAGMTVTGVNAIGTINNDDSAEVTVDDANAFEGDAITFTVTLSEAVEGGLTVTPSYNGTNDTAVEGTDYDENTATLSFTGTKGETKTFTVSTDEDAVLEANETFTVGLSVSDAPTGVTADDTATGTINNNDSAEVTVEDAEASEGDAITFTVTLSEAVQGGLKVTPDFTDVSAVKGTDYDENTDAVTFTGTKGETQTFTVSTTEDAVLEAAETFTVGLTVSDTTLSITATDTATGTINNDDSAAVTVNDPQKTEEGKSMTFTVTLDTAVQGGLTVTVTVGDTKDSATSGTDYDYDANTTALSFTGTANETKTFAVSTTEDTVVEGDETFTVGLLVSDTTVTATDTGTGTIEDQTATEIDLSVDPSEVAENAGATDVTVTASTKDGVTFKADQTVTVTVGDSKDTATSGTDYAAVADFDLTITAGETSGTATFTLTPTDDILIEDAETLTVSDSATDLTVNAATLTLTDDDKDVIARLTQPAISLTASPASVAENAGATDVTVTATVGDGTVAFPNAKTVTLTVGNRQEDTATPGTDYAEVTGTITLTIPAGQPEGTATFTLTPTNDDVVELDETLTVECITVECSESGDLDVAGTKVRTKVTLADDDTATLTVSDSTGLEGEALAFALTLSQPVPEAVTLSYTTQDGTATVADEDYVPATTGSLTLSPRTTTGTLTVPTTADPMVEPDETFTVTVSAAGSRVEVSEPVATGTIQNDDVAHVQVSNIEGIEGETLTFTVTLSAPVYTDVVLAYTTQDGTATVADDDYVPATTGSRLTVPARATTEQTAVQTIADGLLEDDETFTVQLRLTADTVAGVVLGPAPTAPVTAGTVQAAGHTPDHVDGTGTILNNDEAVRERLKRVQTPILADLSLAMTDSVVRAVTARLAQAATQRCARGMTVPGPPADPNADLPRSNGPLPDTTPSLRDVLAGSSFVFSLSGGESTKGTDPTKDPDPAEGAATPACGENQRPLTLWGQGDLRALSGQQRNGLGEAVGWDGNVVGGLLGLDLPIGATGLAGLGVSHFQSAFDYQYTTPRGKTVPGTYETTMTSLHPYAKWAPWAETSLWLTGGYGRGEVTMAEDKLGEQTADSWWATLAAGGLVRLSPDVALLPGGATTVDLKTEAWLTRFQVEDNADFLKDLSVHTHRLRLAVVGEHTWELPSGGVLTPLLEFGVRRDGGDGVTGLGVEIGGRVGYVDPSGRFTVEGRGHVLTAHEGGKDEWGAGGVIRLAPRADGHGLWFNVLPSYGDVQSGAERLWEQGVTRPAGAAALPVARVEAQLGYGVPARAGRGVVTPYGGLVVSGAGERTYAVGTRLALRSGLVCSLEGTRGTRGAGAPENYGVLLRLDFRW